MIPEPDFLNVDLDIESRSPLEALAGEFGERVLVMFSGRMNGRYCLFVEMSDEPKGPDGIITAFCKLVEGLSSKGRRLWDTARRKEFDVGYEARLSEQRANRFSIRASTLQRAANLGASVAVTFYRETTAEPTAAPKRRPTRPPQVRKGRTRGGR